MKVTIEEAAEMWCPFARVPSLDVSSNRDATGDVNGLAFCLSHACMAFRWVDAAGVAGRRGRCGMVPS